MSSTTVYFLKHFNVGLNRRHLNSYHCFCIQSAGYILLVEILEENPAPHRHVVSWKREDLTDL